MTTKILFSLPPNYQRLQDLRASDVEMMAIPDWPEDLDCVGFKIAKQLQPNYLDHQMEMVKMFEIRLRFSGNIGPYLVTYDGDPGDMTLAGLAMILNDKKENGSLDNWLKDAKISL